jgi:two-component system sensor histidine kinase BaeS
VNLIANALAATPAGGSITLGTRSRGGQVGIAVTDTGHGIAAEHLPHVFDRLYRADASRRRAPADGGGSGLGLPIVRRLATLQNGTVDVESTPGRGSTFTLWLPAAG